MQKCHILVHLTTLTELITPSVECGGITQSTQAILRILCVVVDTVAAGIHPTLSKRKSFPISTSPFHPGKQLEFVEEPAAASQHCYVCLHGSTMSNMGRFC
jgi:hypothetical protein